MSCAGSRTKGLWLALALSVLLAGPMVSCKQKEGRACTNVHDCADELVCCFDGVSANEALGVCRPTSDCSPLDGGITEDASATQDASP